MTSYRTAVFVLISLVHVCGLASGTLTFWYSYQFEGWRAWLLKAYAMTAILVTVLTLGLFINGWVGNMTNAVL